MRKTKKFVPIDRVKSAAIAKAGNYRLALHMLCIKMGWDKEYSWYVLRRDEAKCAHGGREEFIRKATRLLAFNYDGIHSGANPALSPRLLPDSNPLSQPIRYPKEWKKMNLFKNFVEIIGNLGDNPKYIMSSQQQPRFTFDICTTKPYKQGEEWKSKSTWVKCTAWGNAATTFSKMQFAKGDRVMVEGELQNNDWVNNQNGEQHHELYLKVSEMRKMAKPAKSGNAKANGNAAPQNTSGTTQQSDYQSEFYDQQQAEMDDLPF